MRLSFLKRRDALFIARIATVAVSAMTAVVATPSFAREAAETVVRRERPYIVEIKGELDLSLRSLLERVSILKTDIETPPVSDIGLRRRVRTDLEHLDAALRSEGYYAAQLSENIDLSVDPASVVIEIEPGERYRLGAIEFRLTDERPAPHAVALLHSLNHPNDGEPARSELVKRLAADAVVRFLDEGYLSAKIGERTFRVDHATRRLTGVVEIAAGTRARFGAVTFEGLLGVGEPYARTLLRWERGEYLRREHIEATNSALRATRLFNSVRIERAPPAAGEVEAPVTIVVSERPFRSVGVGLDYDSADGPGANAFWENRNISGVGRRLRVSVYGRLDEYGGALSYRQPNFIHSELAFLADLVLGTEDTKAYEVERGSGSFGLERLLAPGLVGRVGLGFETATVEAEAADDGTNGNEVRTFASVPFVVRYDSSDSLLEPTKGLRLDFVTTPYFEFFGEDVSFSKSSLTLRGYRSMRDGRWVGALRASVGGIYGAGRSEIPVDKRFFAGGGGSVRGYAYQFAGPLGPDRTDPTHRRPIGGRSVFESGAELRCRVGESFGLVGFVDAGSVYEGTLPDPGEKYFVGAGLGGRYYTPLGPVRIDLATPINGRDFDDPVQVYISIGESY
jgi:translocation and assembly module TamA